MDNCTTHMWLASRAKPLKQLPSVRRPSLVRQVAVQCPTLQEPSPPPRTSLTAFSFTRVRFCQMYFSNSLLKQYFSDMSKFALMKAWRNANCQGSDCFVLQWLPLVLLETTVIGVCCCCWCYNTGEFTTTVHLHSNCCSREWTAAA